jgi:Ca2+-binding EF-hand superfamily protein
MQAMGYKPYINENKKEIAAIFKKYDRANKNYIDFNDLR